MEPGSQPHPLVVGVPTEIKPDEGRVAMTPDGVRELHGHGVRVLVQAGAGAGASLPDDDFRAAGAEVVDDPSEVWERAGLICKVKEPQPTEHGYLRADLTLFTYLHLAAYPEVADALLASGTTGIAYETVQSASGALPLLAPMSEVAGRMSIQVGAHLRHRHRPGGCVATSHETTHRDPVFERHGVLHYAVGNMPGAVPHTSTYALTNVTLPYVVELATRGLVAAAERDPALRLGINTAGGHVVNPAVADALGRPLASLGEVLLDAAGGPPPATG